MLFRYRAHARWFRPTLLVLQVYKNEAVCTGNDVSFEWVWRDATIEDLTGGQHGTD